MLLIDGVRYDLWTPPSEDEFERVVEEHAQDIFGEQSIYLDIRHKLKSKSGIVSIPDGYVIILGQQPSWHIVEVELSSHPLYEHIVPQVSRFISGIKNPATQKDMVSALYQEIDSDEFLRLHLRKAIGATETYKFLAELVSQSPVVTIVIEKHTEQLDEAIGALAHPQIKTVELQTFGREGVGPAVHAHLFKPVYEEATKPAHIQGGERSRVDEGNKSRRFSDRKKLTLKPGEKDEDGWKLIERQWVRDKCFSIWASPKERSFRVSWDYDDYHGKNMFEKIRIKSEDEARRKFREVVEREQKAE